LNLKIKRAYLQALLEKVGAASKGVSSSSDSGFSFLGKKSGKKQILEVMRTDKAITVVGRTDLFTMDSDGCLFSVSADKLLRIVQGLTEEFIEFDLGVAGFIKVKTTGFDATLRLLNVDAKDFSWSRSSFKEWKEYETEPFVSSIERVEYAVGRDGVRLDLMFVNFTDGKCWATDFFRYQEIETAIKEPLALPVAALDVVFLLKASGLKSFQMSQNAEYIGFLVGEDLFVSKKYQVAPISKDVVTKKVSGRPEFSFWAEVKYLSDVLKRILITTERGSARVRIEVGAKGIEFSSKDTFGNSSVETLEVSVSKKKDGACKGFSVHGEYLIQAIKASKDKSIEIKCLSESILLTTKDTMGVVPIIRED
jgi:DNA polymerase III sliding clamp (beta) subunit (PCNA family)